MMSSGTTASTGIYSSSSSLMIPSTAVSDIPSMTTSATDVDVDGSQTDDEVRKFHTGVTYVRTYYTFPSSHIEI